MQSTFPSAPQVIILMLLYQRFAPSFEKDVVCYECYGLSPTQGQYCSPNTLCIGQTCTFNVNETGQWRAGCSTAGKVINNDKSSLQCFTNGQHHGIECTCQDHFCNSLTRMRELFRNMAGKFQLALPPDLNLTCFECGMIHIRELNVTWNVTCDTRHYCFGSACLTELGTYPHSFCGTSWSDPYAACVARPNVNEICFCNEGFCNYPYDPEVEVPGGDPSNTGNATPSTEINPTTEQVITAASSLSLTKFTPTAHPETGNVTLRKATSSTIVSDRATIATNADTTTTANGPIIMCPENLQFGLNKQFVDLAEELQLKVEALFGPSNAKNIFLNTIKEHICAYSGDPKPVQQANLEGNIMVRSGPKSTSEMLLKLGEIGSIQDGTSVAPLSEKLERITTKASLTAASVPDPSPRPQGTRNPQNSTNSGSQDKAMKNAAGFLTSSVSAPVIHLPPKPIITAGIRNGINSVTQFYVTHLPAGDRN